MTILNYNVFLSILYKHVSYTTLTLPTLRFARQSSKKKTCRKWLFGVHDKSIFKDCFHSSDLCFKNQKLYLRKENQNRAKQATSFEVLYTYHLFVKLILFSLQNTDNLPWLCEQLFLFISLSHVYLVLYHITFNFHHT